MCFCIKVHFKDGIKVIISWGKYMFMCKSFRLWMLTFCGDEITVILSFPGCFSVWQSWKLNIQGRRLSPEGWSATFAWGASCRIHGCVFFISLITLSSCDEEWFLVGLTQLGHHITTVFHSTSACALTLSFIHWQETPWRHLGTLAWNKMYTCRSHFVFYPAYKKACIYFQSRV